MKHTFLLLVMCGLLTACVEVRAPVRATTNKEEVFTGEARATLYEATIHIESTHGTTCNGTFDQFSQQNPLMMYISCSDGRRGTITAIRDIPLSRNSGSGTGEWSDGTKFKFAYGQNRIDEMAK